jgi:hypothetical protein
MTIRDKDIFYVIVTITVMMIFCYTWALLFFSSTLKEMAAAPPTILIAFCLDKCLQSEDSSKNMDRRQYM